MERSRSLVTFAFVRDAMQNGDIVAGLVPLFAPVIKKRKGQVFDPQVFSRDLDELCGLAVHPYIVEDWVPRLVRAQLLLPNEHQAIGTRELASYICADPNIPDVQVVEQSILNLFQQFHAFVEDLFQQNGLPVPSRDRCDAELVQRIQRMSFDDILTKSERVANGNTLTLNSVSADVPKENREAQTFDVVCATFLLELKDKHPRDFDLVADIAAGALASEVILSFRVPPKTGQTFQNCVVFLDSPLILDLFDIGNREEHEFAKFLTGALLQEGARLATFAHNVNEVVDVLTAVSQSFERKQAFVGAIGARLRTDSNTLIRIKSVLTNPQRKIKDLGIQIVDAKAIDRPSLKYFDDDAEKDLISAIRPFHRIESREVDAASIASMIRYLYGRRPRGGLMAHEKLFVTKNTGLVRAAIGFIGKLEGLPEITDAPILSDRSMAGVLWVARGGKGAELPMHKLLANCTAALRPRRDVIEKVQNILRDISPEQVREFEALIEDERCGYCLMRQSLGDAELITGASAPRLLQEMKLATADKVAREKDAEISRQREDLEAQIAAERIAKEEAEKLAQSHQEVVASLAKRVEEAENRANSLAEDFARQVQEQTHQHKLERQAAVSRIFSRTKYIEWLLRSVVLIPIVIVIYFLPQWTTEWKLWGGATFVLTFLLSWLQFWVFPEWLFGPLVRHARAWRFRGLLTKEGFEDFRQVEIDWPQDRLKF